MRGTVLGDVAETVVAAATCGCKISEGYWLSNLLGIVALLYESDAFMACNVVVLGVSWFRTDGEARILLNVVREASKSKRGLWDYVRFDRAQ